MSTVLLILILLLIFGGGGGWYWGGPHLGGGLGLVFLFLIVLALTGRLG